MGEAEWTGTTLLDSWSCGGRVSSFRFEKPAGFGFLPGQYAMLRLLTAEGPQAKPFTLAQAPADPYLEITTRVSSSAFKSALASMQPGAPAEVSSARGRNVLPSGDTKPVFLLGGVGVTPGRSILRDAASRPGSLRPILFYGNVDETCVPYLDEFRAMAEAGWCSLVLVYERPPAGWDGEVGMITADLVRRHCDPAQQGSFVVAGPPAMVDAMVRVLDELGIAEERRLVERFSGY